MDQEARSKAPHSQIRKLGLISLIILGLAAIVISVYTLLNPNGIEVSTNTTEGVVVMSETGAMPAEIRIKQGETVLWENDSETPRRIALTTPNPPQELEGFGSDEVLAKGESYSFTFDAKGTFTYEDPEAPEQIKGTIVVE